MLISFECESIRSDATHCKTSANRHHKRGTVEVRPTFHNCLDGMEYEDVDHHDDCGVHEMCEVLVSPLPESCDWDVYPSIACVPENKGRNAAV